MSFDGPFAKDAYGNTCYNTGTVVPSTVERVEITKEEYERLLVVKQGVVDRTYFQEGFNSGKRNGIYGYQEQLVQTIMEYDEGCEDGKFRFIEHLGLEEHLPSRTVNVTFSVEVGYCSENAMEAVESDIKYELSKMSLDQGAIDGYSVSFDWDD